MVPPSDESLKSLSDGVTGSDVEPSVSDEVRSLGDQSTAGDMGSSVSDLDTLVGDFEDDQGEVIDLEARYEIGSTLGQGGMGEVVLARDKRLNRQVAIKRLKEELGASRRAAQRFLTEAQAVAALNHFNIVQIHDYGQAADGPFIVMEYVNGGSLAETLEEGALDLERTIELGCQLCEAIGVAHQAGIIHRDIKPANVLMTDEGQPKLTDFGLARQETVDGGQTQAGAVLGTLDFMPPEQKVDATKTDARSDLWSVGATVYQMATGKSPRVIRLHELPEGLQEVLGKALEDAPDERFQTAEEFCSALRLAQSGASSKGGMGLSNGECAICGFISDVDQKFCQECGGTLEVACLGCQRPIEVWRAFCGQCGVSISEILDRQRAELEGKKRKVDSLRAEFLFTDAIATLESFQGTSHPLLHHYSEWATQTTEQLGQELAAKEAERNTLLEAARKSFQQHGDRNTVQLLEQIPEPLRDDRVTELLEQAQSRISTIAELKLSINEAIVAKRMDNLLPQAEQYVKLAPADENAKDLVLRLRKRLARKQAALLEKAKPRIAKLAKSSHFVEALTLLDSIAKQEFTDDEQAQAWVLSTRKELESKIEPLRQQWREMEKAAQDAFTAGEFGRVIELLDQVPKPVRRLQSNEILSAAPIQMARVKELRREIAREETSNDYSTLALLVEEYLLLKPNDEAMFEVRDRIDKWFADREKLKREKLQRRRAQTRKSRRQESRHRIQVPQWVASGWPLGGLAGLIVVIVAVNMLGDQLSEAPTATTKSTGGKISQAPKATKSIGGASQIQQPVANTVSEMMERESAITLDPELSPKDALRKFIGMEASSSHLLKEGESFSFRVASLTSSELAGEGTLLFSMGSLLSTGSLARLDPLTGTVTYQPSERDGPGQTSLQIRAILTPSPKSKYKKLGTIRALTLLKFNIEEVNTRPNLALSRTRGEGMEAVVGKTFQANFGGAQDLDFPRNKLTYNIEGTGPPGARLDPSSGVFTYKPGSDQLGSSYVFRIRVSDDGMPPLEDTANMTIRVVKSLTPKPKEKKKPTRRKASNIRPGVDVRKSSVLQGLPGIRPGIIGRP